MTDYAFPTYPAPPVSDPTKAYGYLGPAPTGMEYVDVGAQARATTLNRAARSTTQTQQTTGGMNSLIPLVYGTQVVGGKIAAIKVNAAGNLCVLVVWCLGEVDSLVYHMINDLAVPASVTVTPYTGTAGQTRDGTMYAALGVTYADALPGICYSVFEIPPGATTGFPRFTCSIQGKKVSLTSGGAKTFTANPAYHIADFIENATYGMGRSVDWATVATLASDCGQDLDAGAGYDWKRILCLTMDQSLPGETWLTTLRDYAGCWVVPEGGSYRLVLDGPGSSIKSFTAANIVEGSLRLTKRGTADTPTMIEVEYTDTAYIPWRTARYTTPAVTPRRLSRISKPGILYYAQAKRYATERLNESILCDLSATFESFDDVLALQVGELIDITHPIGLTSKVMRVSRLDPISAGRWRIGCVEYDAAKYSNAIATAPTTPDTTMPNPLDAPPLPTGLAWTETLEQSQGGEWVHTITLGWTEPVGYPFIDHYNIWVFGRGGVQFFYAEVSRGQTSWTSPQIAIGVTYAASVRSVSTSGKLSAMVGSPSAITPVGRVGTPPANVASLSADVSVPGTVTLTWPAASGTDIRSYELRYGGANWAAATVLDVVAYPAVRYETDKVPAGSTVFRIKSLDAVRTATYPKGQEATSEVTTTQTVLGKSGTYTPTLTNVSNATSISSRQSLWTRDGNIVTCSVAFDSGCTTAGTEITLRVTLPVASNIDIYDLIGAGAFRVSGTVFGPVRVYGDATNDEAVCAWVSSATLIAKCTVVFSYPVI